MESFTFDGSEPDDDRKAWLGDNFAAWLPDEHAILIRFDDGYEAKATAGDEIRRTDDGLIEIWPH